MTRVTVNRRGLQDLLRGQGTANMLRQAARPVEATAKATAPRDKGDLAESITTEVVVSGDRVVARVIAKRPYAAKVYARNGSLATALDSART